MTKRHAFTEAVSAALFGIFLAIADVGGAVQAQTPVGSTMGSTAIAGRYRSSREIR